MSTVFDQVTDFKDEAFGISFVEQPVKFNWL